jgi:MFS transporter, DHA2 family, methylenomycin A resistance protein
VGAAILVPCSLALPMTASIMAANLLSGRLTKRFGVRASILLGLGLMAAGCLGLLGITQRTSYDAMALQLLVLGAGLGLIVPPMTSALLGSVDRSRSGIAAGTLFAMRQSGSVIGVALFGSLLANRFVTGLHHALVISLAALAIGGLAALEIGSRSRGAPASRPVEGH